MIGKTNSQTGGARGENLNITLKTNQSSHDDLIGATITITYGDETLTQTWNGSVVVVKVPQYAAYNVTVSDVEGYRTPSSYSGTTGNDNNSLPLTFQYDTTVVTAVIKSNQSDTSDLENATLTIGGKTLKNGESTKIATETSVTPSWSSVSGYKSPTNTSAFTLSGVSVDVEGTYQTCIVTVVLADNQTSYNDISSAKATVTGDASATLSSGGTVKVPMGGSITATGSAVSGYNTPTATYTAADKSYTMTLTYTTHILTVNVVGSGATPSGYTVSVINTTTSATIGSQTTASKVYKIPYGVNYKVTASALTGYNAVTDQTGNSNSQSNSITVTYVYNPVKDLSKYDIYGNSISQTTANCYVVSEAGQYKIPLVFGNALKNGSTNSEAYTKNSGSYSHAFVDYNGTTITSPYIETVSGTASSAQLSIADTDGIFTDISIVGDSPCRYVQFEVASVPATGANGIISIKNSSGTIMWSWHIWAWADSLASVEITNSTSVKYKILPYNLGSKWDSSSKTTIKNWFYQFGRPTPLLCPSAYNSTSDHTSYGALSLVKTSIAANLQTGIQNPATFYGYSSSYNYNWFQTNSGNTYNLWDADCTSTGCSDNDVVKTVYDPSPIGFKMPNGNTFTGFSIIGSANGIVKFTRYSGDSTGIGVPMSGHRHFSDGSLKYVGTYGYVRTAAANSQNNAYFLYFGKSSVVPQGSNGYRAYGFSVRPVEE